MKRLAPTLMASLLCAVPAAAQQVDSSLVSLVGAERAFSALSQAQGMRAAFLANLADDGVVFNPEAANGREFWEKRASPPVLLTWRPIAARISAAGDLGFTTGPFEVRPNGGSAPTGHGHYSTVWQRQADGRWKFLADMGISHGQPVHPLPDWTPPARAEARPVPTGTNVEAARASLAEAERALAADAAARGYAEALLSRATEGARVHRGGSEPAIGAEAIRAVLAKDPAPSGWSPTRMDVARSGDFGYAYGNFHTAAGTGSYLHVWERGADGRWRVVLDVTNLPAPRPGS